MGTLEPSKVLIQPRQASTAPKTNTAVVLQHSLSSNMGHVIVCRTGQRVVHTASYVQAGRQQTSPRRAGTAVYKK